MDVFAWLREVALLALVLLPVVAVLSVARNFAGPGSRYRRAGADPAGFWAGLWHGLILPLTFVISLGTTRVHIYEINNRGRWYDFGFLLGILWLSQMGVWRQGIRLWPLNEPTV